MTLQSRRRSVPHSRHLNDQACSHLNQDRKELDIVICNSNSSNNNSNNNSSNNSSSNSNSNSNNIVRVRQRTLVLVDWVEDHTILPGTPLEVDLVTLWQTIKTL